MKLFETKHLIALMGVLALVFSGCASDRSKPAAQQSDQQFKAPETVAPGSDNKLFLQALKAQNEGQFASAIKLWKTFLSEHPKSFEGHNNLGLVYYTQDMLSQALQEFETAHRLEPDDARIRKNLARVLQFKAGMLHENREYFKTLGVLARLEMIVEPEEKQAILFKQEQVEDQIFLQVIKANNSAAYRDFVNRFPDGLNAVRAREYLKKHPHKVSKSTSNRKSWISSGKVVKDPSADSGDLTSWASSKKPPQYGSSRPSATYTPPPAGASKKTGDFFGTDSAAVEESDVENVAAAQEINPVAAVPFEDFEKPERSTGEQAVMNEPAGGKEDRAAASKSDPIRGELDEEAAGLDTFPDLIPVEVAALPAEMDVSADTLAGAIQMQAAEQEQEQAVTASAEEPMEQTNEDDVTVSAEEPVEQASEEEAQQEEPEMAQVENATPETVESESERIARIVKEEIANAENAPSEPAQPEPVNEMEEDKESPQEEPLEVASFDPEDQDVKQETTPAESAPVEEAPSMPDPEEKNEISQETISETVAALIPSPPLVDVMETPADSMDSSNTMVVVQMGDGGNLNVRANPSTQGEILGYLENGDMMPFISESGDWYQIEIEEGLSGWVSKQYSTTRNIAPEANAAPEAEAALPVPEEDMTSELSPLQSGQEQSPDAMVLITVREDATLNVRSLPSPSGAVVDMLFGGDKLPLVKEEGEWYQVRFEDETTGWISKKFSVLEQDTKKASLPVPKAQQTNSRTSAQQSEGMVTTVVVIKVPEGSSLNVRSSPSSQSEVMGSLNSGDMRPLLEESGQWYQVELQDGQAGWVTQKFSGKMDLDSSFLQGP